MVAVFAFNDAPYPAPPWHGFTLDWFLGNEAAGRTGLFGDDELLGSIWTSFVVACWVTVLSVARRHRQRVPDGARPLPRQAGAVGADAGAAGDPGRDPRHLDPGLREPHRASSPTTCSASSSTSCGPGLPLVVLGQFSYIAAIATLTISARLKRFDRTLEEAALNLGASRAAVLRTITLPYLRPALIGSAAIAFLMSFENFNTTLMLVGADSPLTIMMYGRMREGATPVLNAVSLFLMVASALLALTLMRRRRPAEALTVAPRGAASWIAVAGQRRMPPWCRKILGALLVVVDRADRRRLHAAARGARRALDRHRSARGDRVPAASTRCARSTNGRRGSEYDPNVKMTYRRVRSRRRRADDLDGQRARSAPAAEVITAVDASIASVASTSTSARRGRQGGADA